jgi:hypothetical protein
MGFLKWFYTKAKVFKILAVEGHSVLCFVKRSRGVSRAVHMGKVTVEWLLACIEELVRGEGPKEFIKSSIVGRVRGWWS